MTCRRACYSSLLFTALLVAIALACGQGLSSAAADAAGATRLVEPTDNGSDARPAGLPEDAHSGALTVLQLDGTPPGETLELPLEHTDVSIRVHGAVARAEVTQRYGNPFEAPIEAVYTFPLPHTAAVDSMTMRIGERTIRAEIKQRDEAREIYERARAAGQRSALLEQERANIFTQSVANIMPGDSIEVRITYVELLPYERGAWELVFPTVVGPRYIPGEPTTRSEGTGWAPDTDQVPDASRITPPVLEPGQRSGHDLSLAVEIDAGVQIHSIRSVSHAIDVTDLGPDQARVSIHPSDTLPNKDFILRWDVAGVAPQTAVLAHHDDRGGYFSLVVQPQREMDEDQVVPRELIFILDTSGSMRGFPLDTSKEAMRRLLDGMRPSDTFNVVRFAGDSGTLWPEPMPATPSNLRAAAQFVEQLRGAGGTEMRRGIIEALGTPAKDGMLRLAFLLTDGYVGNEAEILNTIESTRRGARVFALGVGSSVNRHLLDGAATIGGGEAFYVRQDERTGPVVDRFFARVDKPALAHVLLDWGHLDVLDVVPRRIPDLWAGQPIVVHGRYSGGGPGTVTVRGQLGDRPWEQRVEVDLPTQDTDRVAVASIWARHRIRHLMLDLARGAITPDAAESEVTRLGLAYRLMTRWTSFVAVEEKVVNVDGEPTTVVQPVELPDGVSYEGVFGQGQAEAVSGLVSPAAMKSARFTMSELARPAEPSRQLPVPEPTQDSSAPMGDAASADRIALTTVAVRGGLQHAGAVTTLEAARSELADTVRWREAAVGKLTGTLKLRITVNADGTVASVTVAVNDTGDAKLAERVQRIVGNLTFPTVAGGGTAEVRVTLQVG